MKKTGVWMLVLALLLLMLSGCAQTGTTSETGTVSTAATTVADTHSETASQTTDYKKTDLDSSWDAAAAVGIVCSGDSIETAGSGVDVSGTTATITEEGTYVISGTLSNGQLLINAPKEALVRLVLNGVQLSCANSAPIYVQQADKVVLILADGTQNTVTDGSSYVFADAAAEEPNAAVFSKEDLTINGSGSLTVNGQYGHGIVSKDDLVITGGTLQVTAVTDGLRGRDSVKVLTADITIQAGGDGVKSNNDEDAERGFVQLDGGTWNIVAGTDGIQAETSLTVNAGTYTIQTGGGSANNAKTNSDWGFWGGGNQTSTADTASAKGLKGITAIAVNGGTLTIDASDDALHSNGTVTIVDGTLSLRTGDDGVHADSQLTISGGRVDVAESYEGLESAAIDITGGDIHITASDDGINAAGGNDGSAANRGGDMFSSDGSYLRISGGDVCVDAAGDGLDSNGDLYMSGGTVLVNGPTDGANGSLDYNGTFTLTGGLIVAAGSSGMAQGSSDSSTQAALLVNFTSAQTAETPVTLADAEGKTLLTFTPAKTYQSVFISTADMQQGSTYQVMTGGTNSGAAQNGLVIGGSLSGGTQAYSTTLSSVCTTLGSSGMGGGMGGMGGMGPGGNMGRGW